MSKIVLTGGYGFLGSHVFKELESRGKDVFRFHKDDYNLTSEDEVFRLFDNKPDIVIHLAGVVGGIGANQENPGKYFYENLKMGMNLIEEATYRDIDKFVQISTVCCYPKFCPTPFREDDIWNGYPEETNAPYGIAKKALLVMLQAYEQQYGLKSNYLIPVNLYGPGDNFNPESSHVIPALIKKFVDAAEQNNPTVEIWGTGKATREFLFVEDAAKYICDATEYLNESIPINIGTGIEISIKQLVEKISAICNYKGNIVWNHSKPDGQPRRQLDITRMKEKLPNRYVTDFDEGLERTVSWYKNNRGQNEQET